MADSTTNLDTISSGQSSKEVTANDLFDAGSPATLLGRRASTTAGLTWGYYGGVARLDDGSLLQIANGTKALTNNATNYLELDTSDGSIDLNTSGWTSGKRRLYAIVVASSAVTSYVDWRSLMSSSAAASVAADDVSIADAGSYFTGTDVEAALQEIGAALGGSGSGDVVGPGSSTNNHVAVFSGTTGKLIADSGLTLAGVNTGDQTITLTGDVTGSGTGSIVAAIANDAVSYAKMQNVSASDKLLGRASSGAGDVEEITCTSAGRALIDDADAAAQRATLGLGTAATLDFDTDTALAANSDARLATQKAVKAYVDAIVTGGASDVMIFKGIIDASTNPNYPAADAGNLYKISVAGKIGGASGANVEVGDTVYCIVDGSAAGTQAAVGANWVISQVNIDGAVVGPASATDGHVVVFDGATGKLMKDSGLTLAGSNTGDQTIALTGDVTGSGTGSFAATIAANAVTNAKAAQMAAHTFKGNNTGSTANAIDLTAAQLTAELNAVIGDSGSGGTKGLVPAPAAGDAAAAKFFKADGTWAAVPGASGGTVTIVSVTTANGVSGSVATDTTTPAITLTLGAITPSSVAATGAVTGSNLSGTNTGDQTNVPGNAGTATALQTARLIGGVSFDGTTNVTPNTLTGTTGASGGAVAINGGTSTTSANPGGAITLTGGTPGATGVGGAITITTGAGGSTSGAGGALTLATGTATSGSPGSIDIHAGDYTGSSNASSTSVLITGASTSTGVNAGGVRLKGGANSTATRNGGPASVIGGDSSTGTGGTASVQGGPGANGGSASLLGGTPSGGNGGSCNITASAGAGTDKNGGNINLTPGAATGTGQPGYVVLNNSGSALATSATGGHTCIPTCAGTPTGTPGNIPAGTVPIVYDSTNSLLYAYVGSAWVASATKVQPFDIGGYYPGIPTASVKVLRVPIARAVTFPANFANSVGTASANATGSTAFDIQKNGSSVGTITYGAGSSSATFASSGGASVSFAAGDVLSIIAPATPDATLADVGIVLAGTR